VIAAGSAGCSKPPDLAAVRSVCLVVEQKHPKVGGDFRLPIEERLRTILNRMGLEVHEAGRSCDARLTVSLTFDVFEVNFYNPRLITLYNGSQATGEARLEVHGSRTVRKRLFGRQATSVVADYYTITSDIVYRETFVDVTTETLVGFWGQPAVIAMLQSRHDFLSGESFLRMFRDRHLSREVAVPALVSALAMDDTDIRTNALDVLRYITKRDPKVAGLMRKTKVVDLLILRTQAENPPDIRNAAAGALGDLALKPDRVVPVLISLLSEESEDLRVSAMVSLGQYGSKAAKAIPLLEAMLGEPSQRVQVIAKECLGEIRK
jgi:hypothetical protein